MSFTKSHDWFMFESKEFGFKMEFPGEPTLKPQEFPSPTGLGTLTMNAFVYDPGKKKDLNLIYMASCTDYPDSINSDKLSKEELQKFYQTTIEGLLHNLHGKLLSEKVVTIDGYSGREIRIDFKDGMAVITARLYLVKNKRYLMETIAKTRDDFNVSIKRFMESFELLK
jgi:hypothetical protein